MTQRSYLKKLQRTLLENEQVALIIFYEKDNSYLNKVHIWSDEIVFKIQGIPCWDDTTFIFATYLAEAKIGRA